MSSKYFFLTKLFLFFMLYQSSFCQNECIYKEKRTQSETNKTDAKFLSNINSEDGKKQKCFSLSNSDVFQFKCCYDKANKLCIKDPGSASDPIICPTVTTTIVNNCGMAGIYQPVTAERCTEISLVDGYCCFLKTKNGDTACVKKKEIDEDDKNMITDDIKKYLQENNNYQESNIESLKCKGFLLKNFLSSILFLLVITMI